MGARHCIEALAASYIESATAIDNSADMVAYARGIAAEELKSDDYTLEEISGKENGDVTKDSGYESRVNSLRYIQADMTNFTIGGGELFDSAWILLALHSSSSASVWKLYPRIATSPGNLFFSRMHS